MKERGYKATTELGVTPSKGCSKFKKFKMNNYAQ